MEVLLNNTKWKLAPTPQPGVVMLQFTDPQGNVFTIVLDDAGKQRLVSALTGGIVLPNGFLPPNGHKS